MTQVQITDQDIESLANKLAAFTKTLSPGELAAFELVEAQLAAATGASEPDVQGFDFGRLDMMGADAHRQEMLRSSRVAQHTGGRAAVWQSVIGSFTGAKRLHDLRDDSGSGS